MGITSKNGSSVKLLHGDCREVLAGFDACCVDSVVTDPPYELGFMGKAWDSAGVAYDAGLWAEVFRVLKPGGHLLAFGGTRTYHRMAVAIEDAGFEIRDSIHWMYGSGFPKSLNIGKAIDKTAGGDHEWDGWGTALKPAHEPIVVARKPVQGTVAENVLEYGTGAINVEGCRIAATDGYEKMWDTPVRTNIGASGNRLISNGKQVEVDLSGNKPSGRWPANLVFTHHADCRRVGVTEDRVGGGAHATSGFVDGYERGDGFVGKTVTSDVWACVEGCPVGELDEQSGEVGANGRASGPTRSGGYKSGSMSGAFKGVDTPAVFYGDTGGASRFFTTANWDPLADAVPFQYAKKPNQKERSAGLDGKNPHPTVKPVSVMRWLVRLVTPPGGVVLDPFAGSGTTLVAALLESRNGIGVELTEDYIPIIERRVAWAANLEPVAPGAPKEAVEDEQPRLF
jgi:site-specific DNA-methyltransferase (adenine-specific)